MRANFASESFLHIPQVHWDYTTRRVLVLQRVRGIKIDDVETLVAEGYDLDRIALHCARMIIKEVLEDGFFHADPHPGNFVVMPGEVIGAMDFGMVGHLNRRQRLDLIRLYIAAIQTDEEGVVDHLIRMGAVGGTVDRAALQRDVGRVLRKYRGLSLKEMRARAVIQEVLPVAFRHHLQLPSEYWLLGKTLAMMEGVALTLAPDFDVFAVAEPYVRRFVWQIASPSSWWPTLLRGASDWAELLGIIPRVGAQFLARAERGELEVTIRHKELDLALRRLDRLANRLSLTMLLAALIVGLALVVPGFRNMEQGGLAASLVIASLALAVLLGIWLVISILRAGRR